MKALILNSGVGKRMGDLTSENPKCLTEIEKNETILSRQLKQLYECGIKDIVITTGPFEKLITEYCTSLEIPLNYQFVNNHMYNKTNYIYSIFLAKEFLDDDILLMHGDLVFELEILRRILKQKNSIMLVSSTISLLSKDFKVIIKNGLIEKIGIDLFDNAVAAQPLYKLNRNDWKVWLNRIELFVENNQVTCYAENAFNEVSFDCRLFPFDCMNKLCSEIDTQEDLFYVKRALKKMNN